MTNTTPPHHLHALSGEPEWTLLDRYFSSECTPEEADAVARWIAADDSHAELIAFIRQIWDEGGKVRPFIDEEADWRALRARIAVARNDKSVRALQLAPLTIARRSSGPSRTSRIARGMAAAAALVVAVGVAAVWGATRTAPVPKEAPNSGHEYATARGQRATVMLVDGTRVWLSVDSKLRIAPGYAATSRDVELEGEAFFEVRHDDALPFRVHTPGAVSEDLGTQFGVRAYPGDSATVVIVTEGAVELRRSAAAHPVAGGTEPGVELTRGQMGLLYPSGRPSVVDGVDPRALLSWRHGALEFEEVPLARAVRELERWYDVEITLGDSSLASVPLTATFDDQAVDQALSVVAAALDVRYERHGRQVQLTSKSARR
jgi:transmembrane sensor